MDPGDRVVNVIDYLYPLIHDLKSYTNDAGSRSNTHSMCQDWDSGRSVRNRCPLVTILVINVHMKEMINKNKWSTI